MTLLPNLHFDDNKPLTSADVAFTVEKLQDAALSAQSAYWQPVSVATPDENTIIFTLPVEDSTFLSHLTFGILPKSIWQHINDQSFEYAKQNLLPVGAGPFKVSAVDYQNSIPATIVLARNNNAVGGTALLHTFTVTAVANSSDLLNALNDGDINFSYAVDPTTLTANSLYDGLNVQPVLNGQTVSIYRSSSDTVLASSAAVAELTTVIDKNALIAIVEHGYGTPAGVQSSTVTNTSLANLPSTGFSLAVENDPDLLLAAQTIARQLGQHGIAVSVKAYDQGTFQTAINTGAVSLFLARNTDLNIPSQYSVALPLYEQATPYIYTTDTHTIVPATLEYPDTQYGTVKDWYTNTDRLWKWFIRKE
jgi:MarR-like DNA-binding transcriptional regulator SgrR of sgrS sRNA